jgi:NitT/TauT family transport system ATP-binding protein
MRLDLEAVWLTSHKTVLFITHSIDEAVLLSDRRGGDEPAAGADRGIIDIPLTRPRGLDARRDPDFLRISEEITGIFLARGVLSRGPVAVAAP